MDWEVCPVKRPLLSVTRLIKARHTAHFEEDVASIMHRATGQKTFLRRVGGVLMLDMWIKRPPPK